MLGNCQARMVADALRVLLPDARVDPFYLAFLAREFGGVDRLTTHLGGYDHVFSHSFGPGFIADGDAAILKTALPRCRLFPTITFAGFHPDMVLVGDVHALRFSNLVASPVGRSHSAIALCAYRTGVEAARTVSLFTDAVFERLGYYELWDESVDYLLRDARGLGFDLAGAFPLWSRRGCFMHDANHPKLHVLADVARRLATEAGLAPLDVAVDSYIPDRLLDEAAWPVYPAIAERYGVPSGPFRRNGIEPDRPLLFGLPRFVEESFAIYAGQPDAALACGRVEAWLADPEIRALFASARGP